MAFTHTVVKSVTTGTGNLQPASAQTYTGTHLAEVDESIADGQTDKLLNIAFTYADLQSFYLLSDQDVTVETNSGSAADDTLTVAANVPYEWQADSPHANPFTADVAALYVTNASGSTATIKIRVLNDATP